MVFMSSSRFVTFQSVKLVRFVYPPVCSRSISCCPSYSTNFHVHLVPRPRSRTPFANHLETWICKLKPCFTDADVDAALTAQTDPDLAFDIFRWTSQQRGYKHTHVTYFTIMKMLVQSRRYRQAESLIDEVISGACGMNASLYNYIIHFCCGRSYLFNRAFDVYKKMLSSNDCKPTLETYSILLKTLLRRFHKSHTCRAYLHAVKSLMKQMKACGVIPDIVVLNLLVRAYAVASQVDESIRISNEMGLYGLQPNLFTYGYIVKGLCETGAVQRGLSFYKEMREKRLIPKRNTYLILICGLAIERRLDEAIDILFDMFQNSMVADILTYRTLLEGLCREGRSDQAFNLLEEFMKADCYLGKKNYHALLNRVHEGCVS